MRIVSYNLRKHRAATELQRLADTHSIDVLCLQEADTAALPAQIEHMSLVHATEKNRLGLAMYVREDRFRVESARSYRLKSSLHDRILSPAHERLLGARLFDHETGQYVVAASFHAAPLTASNSLRRHQIQAAHSELAALGPGLPSIMVGDFNYPVFLNSLTARLRAHGFDLSRSDKRTYTRYKIFRGHFDFATSSGLNIGSVRTLDRGVSDHIPILVRARYRDVSLPEVAHVPDLVGSRVPAPALIPGVA